MHIAMEADAAVDTTSVLTPGAHVVVVFLVLLSSPEVIEAVLGACLTLQTRTR